MLLAITKLNGAIISFFFFNMFTIQSSGGCPLIMQTYRIQTLFSGVQNFVLFTF